ncbi:MAG TPA: PKD domain-containing protein, partial [Thermoplasmata archaeon]|nr:PKD domain-containing protein [Thermoplasmata archaeon]
MALPTALAVMAIVVIVVGAGTYVALNAMKPTSSLSKTCQPANTPACSTILSAHDMSLLVPLSAVQTGLSVPFTALLPSGESGSNFTFNFGDGSSPVTQPSSTVTHSFTYPGSYIASVTANVKGTTHDSFSHLVPITVTANAAALNASDVPTVSGMITANTTVTGGSATGVIAPQGKVSVTGVYSGSPTNPQFVPQSPTITAVGGQISSPTNTSVSASADVSFQTPGIYQIKFVGTAVSGAGSSAVSVTQNYIWTVFVTPTGVSGSLLAGASGKSPHPGTLERFYFAPGGSKTTDPSIAYDSVSGEVVLNLFQT